MLFMTTTMVYLVAVLLFIAASVAILFLMALAEVLASAFACTAAPVTVSTAAVTCEADAVVADLDIDTVSMEVALVEPEILPTLYVPLISPTLSPPPNEMIVDDDTNDYDSVCTTHRMQVEECERVEVSVENEVALSAPQVPLTMSSAPQEPCEQIEDLREAMSFLAFLEQSDSLTVYSSEDPSAPGVRVCYGELEAMRESLRYLARLFNAESLIVLPAPQEL